MSNAMTIPQLPPHLAFLAPLASAPNAVNPFTGGISTGSQGHAQLGIRGRNWRLIDPGMDEEVINSLTVDVIIVHANMHVSKAYYDKPYDPKADIEAPACFSDNGVGPSAQARKPQCGTCQACPQNVFGSKITEQGKKARACADSKRLAVILADNLDGPVRELRLPTMSMKDYAVLMDKMIKSGVPIPSVVFRLSFDPQEAYPRVVFQPIGYANPQQAEAVRKYMGSDEAKKVVGEGDAVAAAPQIAQAPVQSFQPSHTAPAPSVQAPVAQPVSPVFQEMPSEEPKRRGRPRLGAKASDAPQLRNPFAETDEPALPFTMPSSPVSSPAQSAVVNPVATDSDLDAKLAAALAV